MKGARIHQVIGRYRIEIFDLGRSFPFTRAGHERDRIILTKQKRQINSIKADKIDYECHDDFIDIIRIWSGRIFPEKIN